MKSNVLVVGIVAAVAAGWVGRSVFSDDPPKSPPMPTPEEWGKLAEKGEAHARLQGLVGEWNVHGKMTMNGSTIESEGTSSIHPILDGRFFEQVVHATMSGAPFEGRSWMGYDNAKKKIVGTWIDSMGTGMESIEGDEKEPGKVWETFGTFSGPGGTVLHTRDVLTKVGPDELRMESYQQGATTPMMTLVYKRKA
jgi:hypothetical protein